MYAQNIPKNIYLDYMRKPPGYLCIFYTPLPDEKKNNITKKLYAHNKPVVSIFSLIRIFYCRNPPSQLEMIRLNRRFSIWQRFKNFSQNMFLIFV